MAYVIPFIPYIVAAVGAVGAMSSANSKNKAEQANAQISQQQAAVVEQQGTAREEMQRSNARSLIGEQLAVGAQAGTQLSGSRLDILNQSMYNSELDALNIRYDSTLQAQGLREQASIDKYTGNQFKQAGYLNATSSLLSGASGYLNKGGSIPYGASYDYSGGAIASNSQTGYMVQGRH